MKSDLLYTEQGWINAELPLNDKAVFVILLGGRGIGKTFGILKGILDSGQEFVYMRRTQTQIELAKTPDLNPFRALNLECGYDIVPSSISKNVAGFYHSGEEGKPDGAPVGIGVALSTMSTIRGISSTAQYLIFDEFIPERHERLIKEEGTAFLNSYETLNRNREVQGKAPIKCLLLSNSNDLNSPILDALGCTNAVDSMIRKRQCYKSLYNGDVAIYRYLDSPISEQKRNTVLYRVAHSADFENMALENEFAAANYENVRIEQLSQFEPLVSIGNVTVYKHKSAPKYYVVDGIKAQDRYTLLPTSTKAFKLNYWYLWEALIMGRVSYVSAPVKLQFERVFGHG